MTTYELLKTLHVVAVVAWVGGALTVNLLGTRIAATNDTARIVAFSRDAGWIGQRFFLPASVVVLVMGVLAVLDGNWGFEEPWVGIGIVGIVATALTGSLVLGPEATRIGELAQAQGSTGAEIQRRIRRILTISRIDLAVLFVVVVVMVVKPGA